MTQAKLKGLAAKSDQIETILAQLSSCLHFMRESLKTGNENDVLMMKVNTVQQVKELTTPFQPDMLKPNTEANMIFSALADMTALCQKYGSISVNSSFKITGGSIESKECSKCEAITKALHDAEWTLTQEKKLTNELQGVNLELHQKLVSATDPERLRSILDQMVRYKSERDTAESELEDKSAALIIAEREARTAQDSMVSSRDLKLKQKEEELADSRREVHTTRSRMTGYREERNQYREQLRVLKQQLQHTQQHLALETTGAQQQQQQQQQQRDCETPSDGTASPSFKHCPKMDVYAQTIKPKAESCMSNLVDVRGKGGVCVAMEIQKPLVPLNSKQKLQVVVKRESGYETGTLLFVGPIGGKELAGVCLDNRLQSE